VIPELNHLSLAELDSFLKELMALLDNPNMQFEVAILERAKFFADKDNPNVPYPSSVYQKNPEDYLVENFIDRCASRILLIWTMAGKHPETVKFIFDDTNNVDWRRAIKDVLKDFSKWNWPMEPVEFKTKKVAIPIQAADMLAYRSVQITRNMLSGKILEKPSVLDRIIMKRMPRPKGWITHEEASQPFVKSFQIKFPLG
jgi:hypothetical protein